MSSNITNNRLLDIYINYYYTTLDRINYLYYNLENSIQIIERLSFQINNDNRNHNNNRNNRNNRNGRNEVGDRMRRRTIRHTKNRQYKTKKQRSIQSGDAITLFIKLKDRINLYH